MVFNLFLIHHIIIQRQYYNITILDVNEFMLIVGTMFIK